MGLVVMKFGGSSVADAEKIKKAAGRIIDKKNKKNQVVVVVSAPGDMTDDLAALAEGVADNPNEREMDMLLSTGEQVSIALLTMAINHMGSKAISLTGPQAGIFADTAYTRARITSIIPTKVKKELSRGKIVIVAGFQGLNPHEDITTLGRGGSDLTAVALAASLKADSCEIYTDVEGVYTTDPRVVKNAKKIEYLSYDDMLEMAGSGAQIMQARSIEVAKKFDVEIHVRSTFSKNNGTIITSEKKLKSGRLKMEDIAVSGITFDRNQVKLSVINVPDKPGVAAKLFGDLAKDGVNVDMIIQATALDKHNDISFTISRVDLKKALSMLEKMKKQLGSIDITYDDKIAKVSVVGVGMRSHAGVAAKMFGILAKKGMNIEMISTSEIKISCVLKEKDVDKAVIALHKGFNLEK